jgi:hypothetical protein
LWKKEARYWYKGFSERMEPAEAERNDKQTNHSTAEPEEG